MKDQKATKHKKTFKRKICSKRGLTKTRRKRSMTDHNEFFSLNEWQQFAFLAEMAGFKTKEVAHILGEEASIIESIMGAGQMPPLESKRRRIVQEKVDLFYTLLGTISGIAGESPEKVKALFDHKDALPNAPWSVSLRVFVIKRKLRAIDRAIHWLEGVE